jgi:hypothetical protein
MAAQMPFTRTQKQNTQAIKIPAPTKGIVASGLYSSGGEAGIDSAIWMYNIIPTEYGARVRRGSAEVVTNIPGQDSDKIKTVLFYNSIIAGGLNDKIFAVNDTGIYDVTAGGEGPWDLLGATALAWPSPGANSGWVSSVNYTNIAGDHYLLVCDEQNGYFIFDGTTWAAGTFTGSPQPLASDLVQVTEWQGRVWFVERNTATAWFLDPLALGGAIESMNVGNRFKLGGHLVQNSAWTLDAGDGMDDYFVQISSAGDVLVWNGIDIATASDIALVGRWVVGSVPEGRRVLSDFGGDVLVLSTAGIVRLSELLGGVAAVSENNTLTEDITRYIRSTMQDTLEEYGWSMMLVPSQGTLVITTPTNPLVEPPIQFVMDSTDEAWCMFRDLDMVSQVKVGARHLFGTSDGRVMESIGTTDNVSLDGTSTEAVTFSMLTHYDALGSHGVWKRPQFVRPYWVGGAPPNFRLQMRYDFDIEELQIGPPITRQGLSLWDTALWDTDTWAGKAQAYDNTIGVSGMGRYVAVAIRGESTSDLTYVGADLMGDIGGLL